MAEEDVNPKQIDEVEILNPEDRIFKAWGSVEVRDRENDLLPMDEFRKIMPVIMKRGGILMDRHSNRQVGKILNYEFKIKQTDEGPKEGVLLTCNVFKDYEHDDMAWQGVKDGVYKGLSFGGRNKIKDVKFDKKGLTNILSKLEGFEFSLVPGMGNQEATMEEVNFLAKSNVKKAYEKDGAHVHAEDPLGLHNHPEIEKEVMILREELFSLRSEVLEIRNPEGEVLLSDDKDDKDDKRPLIERDLSLSSNSNKSEKYIKEKDLNKSMEVEEVKKQNDLIEKNSNDITEIKKTLDEISEALKIKKQGEEEKDEDKNKKKEGHEEDDEDKEKKKENNDEDKKPEEELEKAKLEKEELGKANGSEGEKKVQLPKVPAEETGGGEPAQDGEGEDVKFIEKDFVKVEEFNEIKKKLDDLTNKDAQTPRPANMINKALGSDKPKTQKDIAKLIMARSQK